jgi:hypothetical protein
VLAAAGVAAAAAVGAAVRHEDAVAGGALRRGVVGVAGRRVRQAGVDFIN